MSILTDMSAQFRAQIQPNVTKKEDYQRLINATFVMGKDYWDLIVAKLDSLLSYITNGSWSVSEKTLLIYEIDNFRGTLLEKLNGFSTEALNNRENIACTIDREVFRFVMKNISTRALLSDVTLSLKTNQGGLPAIQLNSASGLLAEFPGDTVEDLRFQNYDPNKAKHIPPELSQLLCTLMSLCEQSDLWNRLYNSAYTDLKNNVNDATANSLASLDESDHFNSRIVATLSELREYISSRAFNHSNPIDLELGLKVPETFKKMTKAWFSIVEWANNKELNPNTLPAMLSIRSDISTFLGIA
ncbi:hypothetical protein F9222_25265 [Escherichia coli]|nr:hypothetical protein F9222_25265 [Escherichia coli]